MKPPGFGGSFFLQIRPCTSTYNLHGIIIFNTFNIAMQLKNEFL